MNITSTHGFFYNPALGKVKGSAIQFNELKIGNGVCIGHNAVVLPPTSQIGDGAIICPGAVIYFNVPPYTVVSGFPATVKSHRFTKEQIAALQASDWWKKTPSELGQDHRSLIESMVGPIATAPTAPVAGTALKPIG
jgi:UDP-3-O-[3-hydroxymyristoyl] glucosamine N-acyltransferase